MAKNKSSPLTLPELSAVASECLKELQQESDRGAALIGAAFLDDVIAATIRAFFVEDTKIAEKLLGH